MSTLTTPATSGSGDPTGTAAPAPADVPADRAAPAAEERLAYRLLTGPDDRTFCERVSAALADGYRLHGDPALVFNGVRVIAAQAVVLDSVAGSTVPSWSAVTEAQS